MAKTRQSNLSELITEYDDTNFINSISLNGITSVKELKDLHSKLEKANRVVTSYYETLYNDYIMMINSDNSTTCNIELDTIKHYKSLASKVQKAYNYITYVLTFENPFRISK